MVNVNKEIFNHRYKQLMEKTVRWLVTNHLENTEISFTNGLWEHEEGYKRSIWSGARERLRLDTWDLECPADITAMVIEALSFGMYEGFRYNLVSEPNVICFIEAVARNTSMAGKALYDLFFGNGASDQDTFETLAAMMKNTRVYDPFSIIAYIFFLSDKDQYIPVRKDGFTERLPKLGLSPKLVKECTWSNYQDILCAMRQIRRYLQEQIPIVTMLDAQSFLWMMGLVDEQTPEYQDDEIGENESVIVCCGPEGRAKRYYVTRYERDPKNREAAIREHGLTCSVCGFNFEEVYGALGRGFIEVHHTRPLSSLTEDVTPNPKKDLICLCSNCHRMIHRPKNAVMTPEELQAVFKRVKSK